jgi:hypothetical protein
MLQRPSKLRTALLMLAERFLLIIVVRSRKTNQPPKERARLSFVVTSALKLPRILCVLFSRSVEKSSMLESLSEMMVEQEASVTLSLLLLPKHNRHKNLMVKTSMVVKLDLTSQLQDKEEVVVEASEEVEVVIVEVVSAVVVEVSEEEEASEVIVEVVEVDSTEAVVEVSVIVMVEVEEAAEDVIDTETACLQILVPRFLECVQIFSRFVGEIDAKVSLSCDNQPLFNFN